MNFRADIQILRGLSVLFVVFFHLGFHVLQSGFLGVDVFFVISGFLMAVLYDHQNKVDFFKRRARRLLPTYYSVILLTLIASFILNTPNETKQVVSQVYFGSVFSSNIGFWIQNSYFSKTEFNPLLHLWSLGVEIQFYLIIPILVWFFSKSRLMLPLILLGSLFSCFFILGISTKTSFFMMPLRIWEFLIGYGAAIYFTNNGNIRSENLKWLGTIGLVLLLCIPIFSIDGTSTQIANGHPGLYALVISIATGMVLVFGLPSLIENSFLGKILIRLGEYSYSIYLAHFPIIVLYLSSPFAGTTLTISSKQDLLILLILISAASITLHKFVEIRKFRLNIFSFSVISSLLLVIVSISLNVIQHKSLPEEEKYIFNAFQDRATYRCGKLIRVLQYGEIACELTGISGQHDSNLMLVGNSHSDSIKTAFANISAEFNRPLFFIVENNPLMKGGISTEKLIAEAASRKVSHIFLHYSPSAIDHNVVGDLAAKAGKSGIEIIFIDPVPVWEHHIPKTMYENVKQDTQPPLQSRQQYLDRNAELFSNLDSISANNFKRVPVVDYFCQPQCMFKTNDGVPLYFDSGHLTLAGSYVLNDLFTQIIKESVN